MNTERTTQSNSKIKSFLYFIFRSLFIKTRMPVRVFIKLYPNKKGAQTFS